MLDRREFLGVSAAWAVTLAGASRLNRRGMPFSRLYAPHLGLFRQHAGIDPIDQIKFLADEGFRALEDGGLRARPLKVQARMGDELARRGMVMGLFVGLAEFARASFTSGSVASRCNVLREFEPAVATARCAGGRYLAVVPGKSDPSLPQTVQARHAIDTLRYCADICEKHDVVMLLEPLECGSDPSRLFLRSPQQTAEVCRAVGSPSCRLLFDVYQQAVMGENVPQLLARTSDVLGYVQLADSPGRKEPGTGDIDFRQIFGVLDAIGYRGPLGLEHGSLLPGREGERAVIDAYHALDRAAQRPSAAARHRATSAGLKSKTSIV
jgi:hydroxypyruvate isomerase